VHQLLLRPQLFRFMPFNDGLRKVALSAARHPQRQLRVKMTGIKLQYSFELGDRAIKISLTEGVHRLLELLLRIV